MMVRGRRGEGRPPQPPRVLPVRVGGTTRWSLCRRADVGCGRGWRDGAASWPRWGGPPRRSRERVTTRGARADSIKTKGSNSGKRGATDAPQMGSSTPSRRIILSHSGCTYPSPPPFLASSPPPVFPTRRPHLSQSPGTREAGITAAWGADALTPTHRCAGARLACRHDGRRSLGHRTSQQRVGCVITTPPPADAPTGRRHRARSTRRQGKSDRPYHFRTLPPRTGCL